MKKRTYQNQYILKTLGLITFSCLNDRKWTILFINNVIFKLTGYTSDELVLNNKISFQELIHDDFKDYVKKEIQKAIKNESKWDIDYKIKHKDGTSKWVNEKGHPLFNKDGKIDHLEGVLIDISRYK